MSNPFDALNISDDEDNEQFINAKGEQKVRKTHKERRQLKKTGTQEAPKPSTEGVNTEIPARVRDNAKEVRHNRQGRPVKGVPQGHTLDRRSGTGRDDRPRKQGGGRGNIGNVKDQLNRDKYEKPAQQVPATTPVEQVPQEPKEQTKPEEPQKPTLAEYYQSKGISINTTVQKKAPVKGQVNAEWLKKEKLTVLETKEDKKKQENLRENVPQHNNTRVELGFNSEILGFGATKPAQKPREEEPRTQNNGQKGGKKNQAKVNLKEDDFPTL